MENQADIYRLLFETAGEGLVVVDDKGTIRIINPRIEEMFGYSREELIGQPIETLIPLTKRAKHQDQRKAYTIQPVKRSMGTGLDLAGQRKDGSTFPVEVSLNYLKNGEEMLIMGLVTDITARKAAEKDLHNLNQQLEQRVAERTRELRESQRMYSTIARNFPKGTINVFDRDLRYVFVEGMELFRLGITSENLLGTRYKDRLPEAVADSIEATLKKVFEGKNVTHEFRYGESFYMLNAVPMRNEDQEIRHILMVEHNITENKKAEEEMRKALDKERELNELKSRFVSMASHEFRTPLSTILSSTSLIARYQDADQLAKREKHIHRIKSSVRNLTSILNDFLSLDKLEMGKISCHPSQFSPVRLFKEVNEEMEATLKQGQTINYAHTGPDTNVLLDAQLLKNILMNLLSNAAKYSGENEEITVHSALAAETLVLTVRDRGIGIPEADQQHLFNRFFRGHNVMNIQGTGLGLNIVLKYVELMQGSIEFESVEHEGTRFTVTLPRFTPVNEPAQ